jgi:branched-chain amino acid transport system ATP-binding protein
MDLSQVNPLAKRNQQGTMKQTKLLETQGLSKRFGGIHAVSNFSLGLCPQEIMGLIGPNGAGKSTVLNLVLGRFRPNGGDIFFEDQRITSKPMYVRARLGIAKLFKYDVNIAGFTVLQNIQIGLHKETLKGSAWNHWSSLIARKITKGQERRSRDILKGIGLENRADRPAASLSHWEQRLLSLGIALATSPEVILCDEPMAGLSHENVEAFIGLIKDLRESRGVSFIVVEHNVNAVMRLCDKITVLNFGLKLAEGTPEQIADNEEVIKAYLGESPNAA